MTEGQPPISSRTDVPALLPGAELLQLALGRLRDALADTYPTSMSARGLVRDLGLPECRICFERAAAVVCEDILRAARARNQLGALHAFLRVNHNDNAPLLNAAAEVVLVLATTDDAGGILETGTLLPPKNPAPSQFLDARYERVPWNPSGRSDMLAELDVWAGSGKASSAWLLYAEGGIGKTRLALEWARQRRREGWCAGFLPRQPPEGWAEDLCAWSSSLLVVIDYAESRVDLSHPS